MTTNDNRDREKVILAAAMGANANAGWLTSDRIEALTGGHGMLNIPIIAVCNVLATELRRGVSTEVKFTDAVHIREVSVQNNRGICGYSAIILHNKSR